MIARSRSSLAVAAISLSVIAGGALEGCDDDETLNPVPFASTGGAAGTGGSMSNAGHAGAAAGASGAAGVAGSHAGSSGASTGGAGAGTGGGSGGKAGSAGSSAGAAGSAGAGGLAGASGNGGSAGASAGASGAAGASAGNGGGGAGGVMDGTLDSVDHVRRDDVTNQFCPPPSTGGAAGAAGSAGASGDAGTSGNAGDAGAGGDAGASGSAGDAGAAGASAGAAGAAGAAGNAANVAGLNAFFVPGPVCPAVTVPSPSDFTPFQVSAQDGATIAASWKPSAIQPPRGTVIFSYGSDESQSLVERADDVTLSVLAALRFNVVVYDYEGYGQSTGTPSLASLVPSLLAVTDAVHARTDPGADKVVLMGFSLGTVVALGVAAQSPPGVVGLVLVEACDIQIPFYDDPSTGLLAQFGLTLDGWPNDMYSEKSAMSLSVPLLIEQNSRDPICPPDGAQAILSMTSESDKTMATYSAPSEMDGSYELHIEFEENGTEYTDPLATFLKAHLN